MLCPRLNTKTEPERTRLMANVYPFAAWLAAGDVAPSVSSLPYDVMNRAEAK